MNLSRALQNLNTEKKYLLAVSGGADSMVLLELFTNSELQFSVAHCNFQLRGEESNLDEKLVLGYCKDNKIKVFNTRFDTLKVKKNRESIEMVARNLRYNYFQELMNEYPLDYLVTAHHLNDNVETFFINLLRGSGLKGLGGMQQEVNQILRPLVSFTRKEIIEYAVEKGIVWREDHTNHTLEYLRNKIRHKIIPDLEDINQSFLHQAEKSMKVIQDSQKYIEKETLKLKTQTLESTEDNFLVYSQDKLQQADFVLVYNLFSEYGFTSEKEIKKILKAETGKIFENSEYLINIDRGRVLIQENREKEEGDFKMLEIKELPFSISSPFYLKIIEEDKVLEQSNSEYLDLEKITFPLLLRDWKEGDYFYPINGNGKKKLSKYFKDEKIPNLKKKNIKVLCNADGDIVYVLGYRLDNRFKITEETRKYLVLHIVFFT